MWIHWFVLKVVDKLKRNKQIGDVCSVCSHFLLHQRKQSSRPENKLNIVLKNINWWKTSERWIHVQAVISILMSFLITVDWPGEGSSALRGFTKDAFSLTVTTRSERMALHKLFRVSECMRVCACVWYLHF